MPPQSSSPRGEPAVYDPSRTSLLSFADAAERFHDGTDSPRAYLERCLETIEFREPIVRAFATLNIDGARNGADASTGRYRAGRPLSRVDGMPFGVKDLYETIDMPTQMNSPVYEGWRGKRDAAHVRAMRNGGAIILGKTTTTEFGMAAPPPTRNPFDERRTAGGSSSGSAAAIGARMLPVASGSQARASILRPAGYCGNYALKPTYGALNRGGGHSMTPSHSVLGIHAGTLRDMWETAFYIAWHAGGDPGQPGLLGQPDMPAAIKPSRIIRLDTLGWNVTDAAAKDAFNTFIASIGRNIEVVTRHDDPRIDALEQQLASIPEFLFPILGYESRWPAADYRDYNPGKLSDTIRSYFEPFEAMEPPAYREALKRRDALRTSFAAIADIGPCCIAPSQPTTAPLGMGIGDPVYGDVTSILGTPAISLPVLAVDHMPFGVQLMGHAHKDFELCSMSRWLADATLSIAM